MSYLERSNSDESDREKDSQTVILCSVVDKVNDFVKELDSVLMSYVKQSPRQVVMKTEFQCRINLSGGNRTQPKDFQDDKSFSGRQIRTLQKVRIFIPWFVLWFIVDSATLGSRGSQAKLEHSLR